MVAGELGCNNGNRRQTRNGDTTGTYCIKSGQTDALAKLLIEKGLITEAEFRKKLWAERGSYQAMLEKMR